AANDGASVHLSTTMLNDPYTINLKYDVPDGVVVGDGAPTSLAPGQAADIWFVAPLGTPSGPKGSITIVGSNGIETHSVKVDVTTTPCVSTGFSCGPGVTECGSISDNCGHTHNCGSCETGLVCNLGLCVPPRCAHPRPCPRGSHWDEVECACVGD